MHRKRKALAVQLHARKKPVKEIARELVADEAIVHRWIRGAGLRSRA